MLGVLFDNMLSNLNQHPVLIPPYNAFIILPPHSRLFPQQNLVFM